MLIYSISGGKQALNLNYLEPVLNLITQPLISDGVQGVSRTLQAMQDYCITRDDLESLIELCRWPGKADPMAAVDSKVSNFVLRKLSFKCHHIHSLNSWHMKYLLPFSTKSGQGCPY